MAIGAAYDYRGQVLDWFETDFKESAKSSTKTQRLEDGKVSYKFSVTNNSGFDFERFSFKVKIMNKANGQEIGTATIRTGAWAPGETKNFRSKIDIPPDVRSISFVMFSESVDFEGEPAGMRSQGGYYDRPRSGGVMEDLKDLGEMVTGADGSGGVLGELFGTGGMPETTVTKTTTTRTPSGTTTTKTTTTTSSNGRVHKEVTTTRQTASQAQRQAQKNRREVERVKQKNPQNRSGQSAQRNSSGRVAQTYTVRRNNKKLNKIRLGKSGAVVALAVVAGLFAMATIGVLGSPGELGMAIAYGLVTLVSAGAAIGMKIFNMRRAKRVRAYEAKINYNGNTSIDDLAAFAGVSFPKAADDLQKMIVDGFFPNAYVDINNRMLVMTKNGEPIESPEKSAAAKKIAKRKAAREQGMVPESIDDLITMTDDAEIKGKLRSLRTITTKIDQRVEQRPELEDQVKDFREKYYPEVVRLTDEYNEKIAGIGKYTDIEPDPLEINANPNYLEEQAEEIKKQLISLIDSVAEASENLLEKLHEDDIMDITTDIKMLQTTLASKGLLDSDFDL